MRSSIAMVAVLVGMVGGMTGANAAVPSGNLLQNPGAEDGAGGGAPPPPPWTPANGFVVEQYGAENLPDTTVGNSIGGGANFFAGGSEQDVSSATQTVDVSSAAAEIDAGEVSAALAGWLGGYADEGDYAQVTAGAQPSDSGAPFTTFAKIGPITAGDRNNQTALLKASATGSLPAGTRRIRVTITSTRVYGIYTDGYADNVSLVLAQAPIAAPAPPEAKPPAAVSLSTHVSLHRRGRGHFYGRVSAQPPCRSDRAVRLYRGSLRLATTRSGTAGGFRFDLQSRGLGHVLARVTSSSLTVGGTPYTCRGGHSSRVKE